MVSISEALEELPSQRALSVKHLDLTGRSAKGDDPCVLGSLVLRCPALTRLSLARNDLTDESAQSLAACVRLLRTDRIGMLTDLDLSDNLLTEDCCESLAEGFFPDFTEPQPPESAAASGLPVRPYCLNLSGNIGIGDLGVAILASELRKRRCPASLLLRGAGLSCAGFAALAPVAAQMTKLDLSHSVAVDADRVGMLCEALAAIPSPPKLRMLDLSYILQPTEEGGAPGLRPVQLARLVADVVIHAGSSLERLSLAGNALGGEGARTLAEALRGGVAKRLAALDLSANRLGTSWKSEDAAIRALSELLAPATMTHCNDAWLGLSELSLCDNRLDDAAVVLLAEATRRSRSLETLRLAHNEVGDRGVVCLADAAKSQCELLEGFMRSPAQEAPELSGEAPSASAFVGLRELDLSGNLFGDAALEALAEAACFVPPLDEPRGPWGLAILQVSGHRGGARGLAALSQAVRSRSGLVSVLQQRLAGPEPPAAGGGAPPELLRVDDIEPPISEAIAAETSLTRLWAEHFGASWRANNAKQSMDEDPEDAPSLEDELRVAAADREAAAKAAASEAARFSQGGEDEAARSGVYIAHMPFSEEFCDVEELEPEKPSAWLPSWLGGNSGAEEPDALDRFYADDD